MIKGTAKPTALTMNCALALQVSERMPPTMVTQAMITATQDGELMGERQEHRDDQGRDLDLGGK